MLINRRKCRKISQVCSYLCNSFSDFGTISNGKVSEFESFETAAFKLSEVVDAKLNICMNVRSLKLNEPP